MSQTKEENSQANLTQENSETEENTEEEAPEDEVDSQEEDSQEDEDTEEEDETDEEDMEGTEEHHQSEVEELVKAVAPPVKKEKAEKKQRPISVEPKKKFVDDVPKQQSPKKQPVPKEQSPKKQPVPKEQSPKKQKTTGKVVDDVTVPPEECCCGCKVPWSRWEELIISYLHIIIAVSSGLAGAGLSSVVQTFEDTFQNNRTLTPSTPLNSTNCESYLSDSIEIIVTVIYTVIIALFLAQVITLIVLGTERKYKHANFVFLHLRALVTLFTTVYFIVGWSGALGCVTLNILAIVTTMIEVVLTLIEYFKQAKKLGIEFRKDCFPQALPDDNVEPLEIM